MGIATERSGNTQGRKECTRVHSMLWESKSVGVTLFLPVNLQGQKRSAGLGNLRTGYGMVSGGSCALYVLLRKQSHDRDHCHRVAVQK